MPQELRITPVLNGFIVVAGCQTLVYDNPDKIITDFAEWVRNPNQIEGRFGKLMEVKGLRNSPPELYATATECGDLGSVAGLRR